MVLGDAMLVGEEPMPSCGLAAGSQASKRSSIGRQGIAVFGRRGMTRDTEQKDGRWINRNG